MIRTTLNSFITTLADLRPRKRRGSAQEGLTSQPSSKTQLTVIGLMSGDDDNGRLLANIGGRSGWQVRFVETYADARAALDRANVPVILCDRDLLGIGWRRAVERLSAAPRRACVILLSEAIDTNLWNEVVRGGGYDVLSKPLREDNVIRAVRRARSYWSSPARTGLLLQHRQQPAKGGRS